MTISEIAKNHNGRRFKRPTRTPIDPKINALHVVFSWEDIMADDWEFVPETMGFVEAVKALQDRNAYIKRSRWIGEYNKVCLRWSILALMQSTGGAIPWSLNIEDVLATDWIVEEVK